MYFTEFYLYSFTIIAAAAAESNNFDQKCPYRSTVDLTNRTRLYNGSYVYQGILILPENQAFYDYQLLFRNKTVPVPLHLRGCVCTKRKPCIKLCCEKNEYFNTNSYKCEKLSNKFIWDLTIRPQNGDANYGGGDRKVNIFQKFIYQVGVPCTQPEPLLMDTDNWILLEDGNLYIQNFKIYLDTVSYCFTPHKFNKSTELLLIPFSCPIKNPVTWTLLLNTYAMTISILFLIPTILVYLVIKELRGNLRGKLLICYLLSLTIAYGIISFINISRIQFDYISCNLLGYTCYFFFMAAFLWLSVLCYDIWMNFKEINIEQNCRENRKRFLCYSVHAWGWSTIFTGLTMWAENSTEIDTIYKPGIGVEMCWVNTQKWSAAIYFYGPNLIILIFNFVTFAYLIVHIYKVRRDSAKISRKEHFFEENAMVILRLFLIMGVSWIFDIISYCAPTTGHWQLLFVLSDFINALQGLLIFTLFVLKRNVLILLKNRFNTIKAATRRRRSGLSLTTMTSKLQSCTNSQTTN